MDKVRDRGVDALRALAILGVVLGHWLVTTWERNPGVVISSPLAYQPALAPISWVLQTLAVFFFVGGYTAARSADLAWVGRRLRRLRMPPLPLLAFWAMAVVALVDVFRFALGAPAWLGWVNLPAAWLVPYVLGLMWSRGRLPGLALLVGGAAATAVLVGWFGYPASMVGVTGARVSNLSPPTLAALCFGVAQVGLAVLAHGPLSRLMRRPRAWTVTVLANLSAMRVFLWHQTVLVAAVATFSLYGRPDTLIWVAQRLVWVPALLAMLILMTWCRHLLDVRLQRL